eukprot:46634-Chlamydomonas_euryale.AAC.1
MACTYGIATNQLAAKQPARRKTARSQPTHRHPLAAVVKEPLVHDRQQRVEDGRVGLWGGGEVWGGRRRKGQGDAPTCGQEGVERERKTRQLCESVWGGRGRHVDRELNRSEGGLRAAAKLVRKELGGERGVGRLQVRNREGKRGEGRWQVRNREGKRGVGRLQVRNREGKRGVGRLQVRNREGRRGVGRLQVRNREGRRGVGRSG